MTMTQSPERAIIKDFQEQIKNKKICKGVVPSKIAIDFRGEKDNNQEREVCSVPIELLRFRKENGRIASDVSSYEIEHGMFTERDEKAQEKLGEFLRKKDVKKTEELSKLILSSGQKDPAISTCDGFLIDGNRRLIVLKQLAKDHPSDDKFKSMKVVLLPGDGDEGGAPTLIEIEQIENRYQLQSDGKAPYSSFDAALSIRQKESRGFTLEEQMRDDPQFQNMQENAFNKAVKNRRTDMLDPLDCTDNYLDQLDRPGMYNYISEGLGDKEGRWQAFIDFSPFYNGTLKDPAKRSKAGIKEEEVGDIVDAVHKIIRLRTLPGQKLYDVMRGMKKYCEHESAKKEILAISKKVPDNIPEEEMLNDEGEKITPDQQDKKWVKMARNPITHSLAKAREAIDQQSEKETPMTLLQAALKKMEHDDMDISAITYDDHSEAMKLLEGIQKKATEIKRSIFEAGKKYKALTKKK